MPDKVNAPPGWVVLSGALGSGVKCSPTSSSRLPPNPREGRAGLYRGRRDDNTLRPHQSLGWLTPAAFAEGPVCKALRCNGVPDIAPITRKPDRSSWLESVGYDAESWMMEVAFRSGEVFRYTGVDAGTHQTLIRSRAPGRVFGEKFLKGNHSVK